VKRAIDIVGAVGGLVLLSPVLAWTAVAVAATDGLPILFRQQRPGLRERPFTICKFRTMRQPRRGEVWYLTDEERITRLGRFLRSHSIDELPELWNVLRGDMSFVGPRPERPEFVERFEREVRGYASRLRVRPGLTGYAQVNGEYHTSAPTKLKYDLAYIHNRSLWLDFRILSETVKVMLTRRGV